MSEKTYFLVTAAGEAFALAGTKRYLFGRHADADFVIRSTEVSREHARLLKSASDPGWRIENLAPRNGTFVNDKRLRDRELCDLRHGDRIGIGLGNEFHLFLSSYDELDGVVEAFGLMDSTAIVPVESMREEWRKDGTERLSPISDEPEPEPEPEPEVVLPAKGSLQETPGRRLLDLAGPARFTGEILFFNGADHASLRFLGGKLVGGRAGGEGMDAARAALEQATSGNFRTRRVVPAEGSLELLPARTLLGLLASLRSQGLLKFLDDEGRLRGRCVVINGYCRSAGLGRLVAEPAFAAIEELAEGTFSFESRAEDELEGTLRTPRGQRETL